MKEQNNRLFWAKVRPNAIIPTKNSEDAGYDIYPNFESDLMVFAPGETRLVPTGIACAMAKDYYIQVEERGSTGSRGIKRSAGVIDSGYRGEIFIAITNCNSVPMVIADTYSGELDLDDYVYQLSQNAEEIEKFNIINLKNASKDIVVYPKKKAIAQLIVHRVEKMAEEEISYEELVAIPSIRGTGMLGSSNK